jgi:hypothetical protein
MNDKDLAKILVRAANETDSEMEKIKYGYNEMIPRGLENSTAAVYVRKLR